MRVTEYVTFDAVGLAAAMADGELTPAEVEAAAHEAGEAVNPRVNAVVETWEADDQPRPGSAPLAGVPFLIKDIAVTMAGRRMELGSRLAAGHVAADSSLMRRFRRAGLVTFGRTSTPELAYSGTTEPVLHGATRNPWDLERSAGGSSGGAGAAVAAGVVPIAHATDAAGSIRVPAAHNGLFGLKPTRGRVSTGPAFDEIFNGLAVHGSVSRTVRDSAALLDQMRGPEPGDPYFAPQPSRPYAEEVTRDPGTLRVGVLTHAWGGHRTAPPVADALAGTARLLASLAHRVEEVKVDLGVDWEEFLSASARQWTANLAVTIDELAAATGRPIDSSTLEPPILASYHYGRQVTSTKFVTALALRNRLSRALARYFDTHDSCSHRPCRNSPYRWALMPRTPRPWTASAGSAASSTSPRSPHPSTWPAPPPCPSRRRPTPRRGSPSACSSPPTTAARTASSASPASSNRPARGPTEPPRSGRAVLPAAEDPRAGPRRRRRAPAPASRPARTTNARGRNPWWVPPSGAHADDQTSSDRRSTASSSAPRASAEPAPGESPPASVPR